MHLSVWWITGTPKQEEEEETFKQYQLYIYNHILYTKNTTILAEAPKKSNKSLMSLSLQK